MDRLFLTFKSKELEQKYRGEQNKEGSVRLKYICITLIVINSLVFVSDLFKAEGPIRIYSVLGFIFTYIIVLLFQRTIQHYSKSQSAKRRDHLIIFLFILFHIMTAYQLTINISIPNRFEEIKAMVYMTVVMYFISTTLLGIWWMSLLIQVPAIILNNLAILQYSETEGTSVDSVISVSDFVFGIMAVYSYLSEKQLRESFMYKEELRIEKEKIKDFFEMLPVNIIKINVQTKESELNQKAKDMLREFDCSFEDFSRRICLMNRMNSSLWEEIVREMKQLERKNKRHEKRKHQDYIRIADYTYSYWKDGREKIIEFEIQFSHRDSNPEEVLIILQKKNKQRRLKEEKLANIYKNNLIRGLSHDLKTPLNGIISLLNGFPAKDRTKNNYGLIHMSAQFLLYKLKDMLDYSQIETGLFVLKEESICLSSFFLSIIKLCQLQADLEEVTITFKIDQKLPPTILGDRDRIEQVIIHLLQNAIKYTPKSGQISLLTEVLQEGLKIAVKDTGIGITQAKQNLLFSFFSPDSEELFRNHPEEEEKEVKNFKRSSINSGIINLKDMNIIQHNTFQGLGLQITQKLVKSMNSKLRVKSRVNEGAEFYFVLTKYLPKNIRSTSSKARIDCLSELSQVSDQRFDKIRKESNLSSMSEIEESLGEELFIDKKMSTYKFSKDASQGLVGSGSFQSKNNKQRALVVDDNGVNRIAISGLLRRQGIDVIQRMDGLEAVEEMREEIERFKQNRDRKQMVDYIFMDLNMPNMDGIEATSIINTMLNETHIVIPIFALTAYDTNQLKTHCLAHGFTLFLTKPIKQDVLTQVLFKYLHTS